MKKMLSCPWDCSGWAAHSSTDPAARVSESTRRCNVVDLCTETFTHTSVHGNGGSMYPLQCGTRLSRKLTACNWPRQCPTASCPEEVYIDVDAYGTKAFPSHGLSANTQAHHDGGEWKGSRADPNTRLELLLLA